MSFTNEFLDFADINENPPQLTIQIFLSRAASVAPSSETGKSKSNYSRGTADYSQEKFVEERGSAYA